MTSNFPSTGYQFPSCLAEHRLQLLLWLVWLHTLQYVEKNFLTQLPYKEMGQDLAVPGVTPAWHPEYLPAGKVYRMYSN